MKILKDRDHREIYLVPKEDIKEFTVSADMVKKKQQNPQAAK